MIVRYTGITKSGYFVADKLYEVVGITNGWYGIRDESGGLYLYPSDWFEIVDGSNRPEEKFKRTYTLDEAKQKLPHYFTAAP
jgi:hypothetical protein